MVLIERNILIKIFPFRLSELKSRVDELESAEKDHLEKLDDRKAEIDSLKREISRLKTVEEEVSNLLPTDRYCCFKEGGGGGGGVITESVCTGSRFVLLVLLGMFSVHRFYNTLTLGSYL